MRKRYLIATLIVAIGFTCVGLALMAASLFFQGARPFLMGSGMFCVAITIFYPSWLQLRAAKTSGTPIPWWKHYQIMLALFFFCFGGIYFFLPVFRAIHATETALTIALILYLVLTFAIGIYGMVLTIQAAIDKTKEARNLRRKRIT